MPYTDPTDALLKDILTTPKTFAIVGASHKKNRPSYIVMKYLINKGFHCIPVNPGLAGKTIMDKPVVASITEINEPIDVVDIFRISDAALEVTEQAIEIKAKTVWMQIKVVNEKAADLAQQAGLDVVMNRCPKIEYERLFLAESAKP